MTQVNVIALHQGGKVIPQVVIWPDGRRFDVEAVDKVVSGTLVKAGCLGLCYVCRVRGKTIHLHDEGDLWYLEAR